MRKTYQPCFQRSALDHIELTYHDVTVFAIPEFKSLEVLEKKIFALILLSINPDPNYKEKNLEKKTLTQKYKIVIDGIRTPNYGVEGL